MPPLCGPALNDSALRVKLPTEPFVVSKAEPVRVGLDTATELAPLPVNVMLWLLGPNVIWAACAPDPQSAASPMAIRSVVFIAGLSKGKVFLCFMGTNTSNYCATCTGAAFSTACEFVFAPIQPQCKKNRHENRYRFGLPIRNDPLFGG